MTDTGRKMWNSNFPCLGSVLSVMGVSGESDLWLHRMLPSKTVLFTTRHAAAPRAKGQDPSPSPNHCHMG